MNNNILPSDEFIEYEGQFYSNPQKGLEESNTFIDNLRNVQNANNAEINAQTRNLGTAVPSNLGGLVGGEGYWTSRYQTPQTNAVVANLRATAQAQALNEALSNNLAMYKQRYNNAYKAARKRAASYGGGYGGGGVNATYPIDGLVEEEDTSRTIGSVKPSFSPAASGTYQFEPKTTDLGGSPGFPVPTVPSQIQNATKTLYPAGSVDVKRNASGVITGLTYNGKTYSGGDAREMWSRLSNLGNFGR